MEQWLTELMQSAPMMPYLVVVLILTSSGVGAPIPEDIPLLLGGVMCGLKNEAGIPYANVYLMIPAGILGVLAGDFILYSIGRRYGYAVMKTRWFGKFLSEKYLQKAERAFHRHGGKALFFARFVPGVRAATYFSAGVFKIPVWKMCVFDGGASLISTPTLVLIAYFGADNYEQIKEFAKELQFTILVCVLVTIAGIVAYQVWKSRKKKATA